METDKVLLKGAEVATMLAISRAQAYKWMATGVLPVLRIGGSIRVPREALLRWIEHRTQQPEDCQ